MSTTLRQMTLRDLESVYAIEQSVHISPWSMDIFRDCIRVGYDCRVLEINTQDTRVVGGYIISRLDEGAYHILNLAIEKSFQSKGYGRALLEKVMGSLSSIPMLSYIKLEVRPSNTAAIHLYKSLGFEQFDIIHHYYQDTHGLEDAVLLRKYLLTSCTPCV